MRVLLTSIGSAGDINPFLAVGSALLQRGHQVTLLANPYFEPATRAVGLDFEPLGDFLSPHEFARDNPQCFGRFLGPWHLIHQWLVPAAAEIHRRTIEVASRLKPRIIAGHQISFGAPWAAARLGIPFVTCILAPATALSIHSPSVYATGQDLTLAPLWRRRLYTALTRRAMGFILDRPLNIVRKSLGLPPATDTLFGEMLSQHAVLGLWSPALRGPQPDDPARMHICGFPWHDSSASHGQRGAALDPVLERFLDHPEPPIIFTLGSVLSHGGHREFAAAARACQDLGRRGVLVTGGDASVPRNLPPTVLALDYVPYSLLMSRGAATAHHGGIGTTAQALRAGKPTIIIPHAHDQFDNAARVQRSGAGLWLPRRRASPRGLARAIDALLRSRDIQTTAARLGSTIAAEDGAARAAEHLEALADQPAIAR